MPQNDSSRARARLLRERVATIRKAHAQALARAGMNGTEPPPESHLAALGVADHFPAAVANQDVNRHLLASVEALLTYVERELVRMSNRVNP